MSTGPYTQGDGTVSVVSPGSSCDCCPGVDPTRCVCMCDTYYEGPDGFPTQYMTADIAAGYPISGFTLTVANGRYKLVPQLAYPGPFNYHGRQSIVDAGISCFIPSNNTTPNRGAYTASGGPPWVVYSECNVVSWNCNSTAIPGYPAGTAVVNFVAGRGTGTRYADGTEESDTYRWQFDAIADTYLPCPDDAGFVWLQVIYTHQHWIWYPWSPEPIYLADETTTTPNPPGKVLLYCGWLNRAGGSPGVMGFGGEASVRLGNGFTPEPVGGPGLRSGGVSLLVNGADPYGLQPLGMTGSAGPFLIDGEEPTGGPGGGGMAPPLDSPMWMAGLVDVPPAQEKKADCGCGKRQPIKQPGQERGRLR